MISYRHKEELPKHLESFLKIQIPISGIKSVENKNTEANNKIARQGILSKDKSKKENKLKRGTSAKAKVNAKQKIQLANVRSKIKSFAKAKCSEQYEEFQLKKKRKKNLYQTGKKDQKFRLIRASR